LIGIDDKIIDFSSVKKVNQNDFVIKCRGYFEGITYIIELNLFTRKATITKYKLFTNKIKSVSYYDIIKFV